MTLEALFSNIALYHIPIILILLFSPWMTYLACHFIPGKKEEPYLLSINLGLSMVSMLLLSGYLAYVTNTDGWQKVIKQADILLLFLPTYHLITSLWLSSLRIPLQSIPAFRTLQGLTMLGGVFMVLSWLASKIHIVLFSYLPFSSFLVILAVLLGLGYVGYRKLFG
ncbi:MAG: hypothetical protein QNJ53_27080 [Pleurocapsa sp. MO_192.B19]|nr:hypothetical protein [Pleurocapsa sp. MO_192.B19]